MAENAQWLSLKEAVEFGATQEVLPSHALVKLFEALKAEKIRSRAEKITRTRNDVVRVANTFFLQGSDWINALKKESGYFLEYDHKNTHITATIDSSVPGTKETWRAEGLQVFRKHVELLWPVAGASKVMVTNPKARAGRPMKYEWSRLAGFIAHYIVQNDYPKKRSILNQVACLWFEENGGYPDKREIERFVEELYRYKASRE
ncbi:hypothetical protein MKK70_08175 [Methylobacterium sp. E-041]|nr:hypothetical protein [Methylobacterium sp. E-041]